MIDYAYQKAEKKFWHDKYFDLTVLRLIPAWIVPNHVTMFRFLSTPFIAILLYYDFYILAFWGFLFLAFTDAVDGSLARTRSQITEWGKIYDPLADKVLIATMIYLIVYKFMGFWISTVIIGLEIIIIIAAWARKREGRVVQANWWGKTKMLLQVLGVAFLMLSAIMSWPVVLPFASGIFYLAIAFAVISLLTHGV